MATFDDLVRSGMVPQDPNILDQIKELLARGDAQQADMAGNNPAPGVSVSGPAFGSLSPITATTDAAPIPRGGLPYAAASDATAAVPATRAPPTLSPEVVRTPETLPGERQNSLSDKIGLFLSGLSGPESLNAAHGRLRQDQTENLTLRALMSHGLDEVTAKAAARDPRIMQQVLGQIYAPKTVKLGPNEAVFATGDGREIARNADKLMPIPEGGLYDPNTQQVVVPGGKKPSPGYEWVDAADHSKGQRPTPGGPADLKLTEARNKAQSAIESVEANLTNLENNIKAIKSHPGLAGNFGISGVFPNIPGGDAANAQAKLDQLKAQGGFSTLQAMRDASKTGGALGNVSNAEGIRLENAFAALQRAQSVDQVKQELDNVARITREVRERTRTAYDREYGSGEAANSRPKTPKLGSDPLGLFK